MSGPATEASRSVPTPAVSLRRFAKRAALGEELGVLLALVVMVLVVNAFNPGFLGIRSVANITQQAALYGIIALGVVFVVSMGDIDLSVGGNYALSALGAVLLIQRGLDPWLAAVAAIAIGVVLGGFNALVANVLALPLIIITLGTVSMFRGLTLVLSDGQPQSVPADRLSSSFFTVFSGTVGQISAAAIAFGVLTVVISIAYRRSRFGFSVRAVGSNPTAARLCGYSIPRIRLKATILVGALCGLAAALYVGFFQSASPTNGVGYELQVIAAVVIGGTALSGGRGTVVGAFIGALILSVISASLTAFGVSVNWAQFVTGTVIVGAVALDSLVKRRQSRA